MYNRSAQSDNKLMRKVLVELEGDKLDIEELQSGLSSGNWTITKEGCKYYLNSDILDELSTNRQIADKAAEFIDIINGAANILYIDHGKVKIGNHKIVKDNKTNYVLMTETGYCKLKSQPRKTFLVEDKEISKPTIETWLVKSQTNRDILDILHFFNEITWWNLYKIYEIIRDDVGGQKGLTKIGNKTELNHFTQAAQSRELLGDKARHASKKYKPPTNKLTIDHATDIIVRLFKNWLDINKD